MTPSHRLKLYRSDDHLTELKNLLKPLGQRGEYPVVENMQPQRKGPIWNYRLDLDSVEPDEMFPIIFGDYLFNVRSALDHLVVAIAPAKHKYDVSFPICSKDPLARDEASGDYLDADAARAWSSRIKGLPDDCIACLTELQPHEAARLHGGNPRDHALAMLSAFQNADKHRKLVPIATGLGQAEITYEGQSEGVVPTLKNGAQIGPFHRKVDVKVEGTPRIGVSAAGVTWDVDEFTYKLNQFVMAEVLPRLEPFLE